MILSALESYHPVHQISVFEMACNTESNYENIEDCISVGCDVNKVYESYRRLKLSKLISTNFSEIQNAEEDR